ncbi:DDE-type integrase/transposase/recombinase, partial [Azospirillum brasilense]|nr:DDE-type integrase/transposase/recombinase [Azospirillum brasilense]
MPRRALDADPSLKGRRPHITDACALRGAAFEIWTETEIRKQPRLANCARIRAAVAFLTPANLAIVQAGLAERRSISLGCPASHHRTGPDPCRHAARPRRHWRTCTRSRRRHRAEHGIAFQEDRMTAIPLKFQSGDSLAIRDTTGATTLWGVVERKRGGYLLKPHDGSDPRTWSDDDLDDAYGARRLTHFPCDLTGLPKSLAEVLDKTWEYWPEEVRYEAERRLAYVMMADALRSLHSTWLKAFEAAAETVYAAHHDAWAAEDRELMAKRAGEAAARRRKPTWSTTEPTAPPFRKPHPLTIRRWYRLWDRFGRDIRVLIPHHHRRGNHQPGLLNAPEQSALMTKAIKQHYLGMPRKRKSYAYQQYVKACQVAQLEPASYRTFRLFIRRNHTEREEYESRYGKRAAYLKFGIFDRTTPSERPLEEVELDHCLIDLIASHPLTDRLLGRPWLTALLDRATRVIMGVHLSFEVPSYACLQRALAHAFWKKDLSGFEDLEHDWPCHGIPEWIFSDNGRELRSRSLRLTETMLDFAVVNLPVKSPWLKGAVERLFGTIGVQVFSHQEGTVLSRTKDFYNPVARARRSLPEINHMLLKWIVDDYHVTKHGTLGVSLSWSPFPGQSDKLGSPIRKDGPDDGETETVFGGVQGEGGAGG